MKNITDTQAIELFKNNPISKGSTLTPYKLIVGGIITHKDWLKALKHNTNKDSESFEFLEHKLINTRFGKKILDFIRPFGYQEFRLGKAFKKRSKDCELESIKLINLPILPCIDTEKPISK